MAGAALTARPPSAPLALAWPGPAGGWVAALAAVATAFVMGVDFPGSSRRLSRLA